MSNDKINLHVALQALDELACWSYAPTMEPRYSQPAREALVKIRGGDGRPELCKLCGKTPHISGQGCLPANVRFHTLQEIRNRIETLAKAWEDLHARGNGVVGENDAVNLRRWSQAFIPEE